MVWDAHEGLKAAITKVLNATWQRCRVPFMRNALAYAGKTQRRIVSAWVGTAFAQNDATAARKQWREVADQVRSRVPKLAALMDEAEADVLAYMGFPAQHRAKLHSTNPLERLNGEIKRRSDVVGVFPNEEVVVRLIGALLLKQNGPSTLIRRIQTVNFGTPLWLPNLNPAAGGARLLDTATLGKAHLAGALVFAGSAAGSGPCDGSRVDDGSHRVDHD